MRTCLHGRAPDFEAWNADPVKIVNTRVAPRNNQIDQNPLAA
jgi:hypothetical protein